MAGSGFSFGSWSDLHLSYLPAERIDDEAPLEEVSFSLRDGRLLAQTFVAGEGEQPAETFVRSVLSTTLERTRCELVEFDIQEQSWAGSPT